MKYLFVFNPKAKRYDRDAEAAIVAQASQILPRAVIRVAHTVLQGRESGRQYGIDAFAQCSQGVDCVVAVGGDGTINIVASALMQSGAGTRLPLGVIPFGTGNNLVRSYGLERDAEKALVLIRQRHTVKLDIGLINQQYYFINASFGFFPHLIARRVTKSLVGWTYDALRHIGFTPWPARIRYTDAVGRTIGLPSRRYLVGALLNTSHYGSILHMAPDAVSDDGLFDIKLIGEAPRLTYPILFTVILTGQYELARNNTTTFRARRMDVLPDTTCHFETDGDLIPMQKRYTVEMAGQIRLIVPSSSSKL
ncbi:putative lipid kinase YegS [Candidatus Entotheonellaceae bacterium PAL068K]